MLSSIFIFLQNPIILSAHIPAPKTCMPLHLTPICEPRKNHKESIIFKTKLALRSGDNPSTDYTQAAFTRHGQGQGKQGLHTEHPKAMGMHNLTTNLWQQAPWKGKAKPTFGEELHKETGNLYPLHCYQNDLGMLMFWVCREKSDISQQCWIANKHFKWKHDTETPIPKNAILQHTLLTTTCQHIFQSLFPERTTRAKFSL